MSLLSQLSTTVYNYTSPSAKEEATDDKTLVQQQELEQKKIEFLNILLTQLQNQNPLEPMSTSEYTAQLVQYSQLEQQLEMNDSLRKISAAVAQNENMLAMSYVGKTAEFEHDVAPAQNDKANWTYTVLGNPESVKVTVLNEKGEMLYDKAVPYMPGQQFFTFDAVAEGKTVEEGEALKLVVSALDSSGKRIPVEYTAFADIDGVNVAENGQVFLTSGRIAYDMKGIWRLALNN